MINRSIICLPLFFSAFCSASVANPQLKGAKQIWRMIQTVDKEVAEGEVQYEKRLKSGVRAINSRHVYSFDVSRRSRDAFRFYTGGGRFSDSTFIFDGKNVFMVGNLSVNIVPGTPQEYLHSDFLLEMSPRPCFALGRGLSSLRNVKIKVSGKEAIVEGDAPQQTKVRAVVSLTNRCLMRSAQQFDYSKRILGSWSMQGTLNNDLVVQSSQIRLASKSSNATYYKISEATFKKQADALFNFPLKGVLTIVDSRLGKSVVFRKSSLGTISKAELLEMTRSKTKDQEAQKNRTSQAVKIQSIVNMLALLLPILLLGLWCSWKYAGGNSSQTA